MNFNDNTSEQEAKNVALQVEEKTVPRMDGGYHAWAAMFGGWCVLTATFGYSNAFGVFQDFYTQSQTASSSRISWIGSTQLFFLIATALPAGKLLDMGHFRITTLVGSTLYVFSLFMLSIAHLGKYYQIFLTQGVGMGIGAGLLYVPAVAIQAHHWRIRRSVAMGIVVTGSSVGGIIFPIMLNNLFPRVGFAWGVRASAFLVLGLLFMANCLMTSRPEFLLTKTKEVKPGLRGILTDTPYIVGTIGVLIVDWGFFFPYFYLQLFATLHGVDSTVSFYTLAIMNACSIPGRIIPNILAQSYGIFNALIVSAICCCALIFALFGISSVGSTVSFAILYGFFSGAFLSLLSPAVASLAQHENEVGVRLGFAFFVTSFGALTGTPIDGALLGDTFPWSKAIIFSGTTAFAGTLLIIVAQQLLVRRRKTLFV